MAAQQIWNEMSEDRRQHQRIGLVLKGRYLLSNGREYPCSTIDLSENSVALRGIESGRTDERVIAYVDELGRLEGIVIRQFSTAAFAMRLNASEGMRRKIVGRISSLTGIPPTPTADTRTFERTTPSVPFINFKLHDGRETEAAMIDVSPWGAALKLDSDTLPPVGAKVILGRTAARVVRHFAGGVGINFEQSFARIQTDAAGERDLLAFKRIGRV